jgi:hypothetical protein
MATTFTGYTSATGISSSGSNGHYTSGIQSGSRSRGSGGGLPEGAKIGIACAALLAALAVLVTCLLIWRRANRRARAGPPAAVAGTATWASRSDLLPPTTAQQQREGGAIISGGMGGGGGSAGMATASHLLGTPMGGDIVAGFGGRDFKGPVVAIAGRGGDVVVPVYSASLPAYSAPPPACSTPSPLPTPSMMMGYPSPPQQLPGMVAVPYPSGQVYPTPRAGVPGSTVA